MTRTLVTTIALSILLGQPAFADAVSEASELASLWDPTSVDVDADGALTIVLPQRQITDQIYLSLMTSGLCMGPLLDQNLSGVSEIRVLNEFEAQGYVYERGLEDCDKLNDLSQGDPAFIALFWGATRMW